MGLGAGFINLLRALANPGLWLDWPDTQALVRFIYFGGSTELLVVLFWAVIFVSGLGMWRTAILRRSVGAFNFVANAAGKLAAWAIVLAVFLQVMITLLTEVFHVSKFSFGPFGTAVSGDAAWFIEGLRICFAAVVCMGCGFLLLRMKSRGGFALTYFSFRVQKIIQLAGVAVFVFPPLLLIWRFAWFHMWRCLITPTIPASMPLDELLANADAVQWTTAHTCAISEGNDGSLVSSILLVGLSAILLMLAVSRVFTFLLELRQGSGARGESPGSQPSDSQAGAERGTSLAIV